MTTDASDQRATDASDQRATDASDQRATDASDQRATNASDQRIAGARLYFIADDTTTDDRLEAAIDGGVDIVQLRMLDAPDDQILATAGRFKAVCQRHGVPLILGDRPDLVEAAHADGAHLETGRFTPEQARALVGSHRILGLSTGSRAAIDAAARLDPRPDYISVGPVHATNTKPQAQPVGPSLLTYASRHMTIPFFAVGGIVPENTGAVAAAGAQRIAVAGALQDAPNPARQAVILKAEITSPFDFLERYRARTEAQNAAARAKLTPLAPGERPWPLRISAALAALAGLGNLIAYAAGDRISGSRPAAAEVVIFSAVMLVLAYGMWARHHQAVLAFMAILAIVVILFSLFLVEASNLLGLLVPLVFIGGGGVLFWKLVRVLGRLQVPASH